jgi:hypothetical protein
MAALGQLRNRALAPVFGLVMVGAAAVGTHGPAVATAGAAALAVGIGVALRPIATLAVLLSVFTMVLSDPSHLLAALSGLCAAGYLVCRHADAVITSWPTLVAAVGFTFAGLVATSFPLQLPWLPLAAPLAVVAIYVLATRPFVGR